MFHFIQYQLEHLAQIMQVDTEIVSFWSEILLSPALLLVPFYEDPKATWWPLATATNRLDVACHGRPALLGVYSQAL